MSTRYEFSQKEIQEFCDLYGVTIDLTVEQRSTLNDGDRSPLLLEQITSLANQICSDDRSAKEFIEEKSTEFNPISLTLFVLNEALWKIMTRRPEHSEKMLPMTTIPWFYYERSAEDKSNPLGARRHDNPKHPLTIKIDEDMFSIDGVGGDFCGLLEGRFVDKQNQGRSIIIPGSTGIRKIVPNYESQKIRINIKKGSAETILYPSPNKKLDYNFSEHPKIFYDHGMGITADGKDVYLQVGNRKNNHLLGEVMIFIGKDFDTMGESTDILLFHVWLSLLSKGLFL